MRELKQEETKGLKSGILFRMRSAYHTLGAAHLAYSRFHQNQFRCLRLTSVLDVKGGIYPVADILRSVIVLTHASMEDLLRTLAREQLVHAKPSCLKGRLRFPGTEEKVGSLGLLLDHCELTETVEEVVRRSIDEYLARTSINHREGLVDLVGAIGVGQKTFARVFEKFMPAIEWAIARRHRIVHYADFPTSDAKEAEPFDRKAMVGFFDAREAIIGFATALWPFIVPNGSKPVTQLVQVQKPLTDALKSQRSQYLQKPKVFR